MGGRGQLSNPNRRVCISMPRDTYSGPGGADDMRAEPSTGRVVGLKATLSWQHLVGVTFFAVCGGAYGIEDSVGAGGPRLTLIGVLVLPWLWSLPIALMTAELGAMIPETGGYVMWIQRAFGPFWAKQNAVWNLVSNTFDNALYPVMFVDYLGWFPMMRLEGIERWLASVLMLSAVTVLNMMGVDVVANASNLFAIFVISPFIALVIAGAFALPPSAWFYGLSTGKSHTHKSRTHFPQWPPLYFPQWPPPPILSTHHTPPPPPPMFTSRRRCRPDPLGHVPLCPPMEHLRVRLRGCACGGGAQSGPRSAARPCGHERARDARLPAAARPRHLARCGQRALVVRWRLCHGGLAAHW